MTLQPAGVQLVVADQQAFLQALAAANGAVNTLGVGSASAAQKIDQLSTRIEFQKRSLGILAQELTATTAKYGEGSIQAQKKQLAVDKLTASLAKDESALSQLRAQEAAAASSSQQLAQSLDKAGQSGARMGEVMTGALRTVGEFAVNALASAGRAVVDFVRGSEEAAKQYQKTMAEIVGLTGTSTQAVGQLSQQVLQLAGPVAKAPQELADALYFVLSSGVDAAHAMDVVTASAKASAAGLGETKIVADLVTSVMNAYGQQNISAAHATDILTQAVKDGKGEPDQYAAALGRVLPIASAAGVNFEQVAASIATMTRTGLDANEATTALRGIIGSLEAPVAKTRSALHDMGLSADDVRASIRDRGLLDTLQMLMEKSHGNLDVMSALVPNIRALTGVLSTVGSQSENYAQILGHMNNAQGATDRAFQEATKTLDFQEKALKAAGDAIRIEIGSVFLPYLAAGAKAAAAFAQSLVGHVGPAIKDAIAFFGQVARTIQTYAVPAFAGLTAATIAYGIASGAAAIGGIQNLGAAVALVVQRVVLATPAIVANAAAVGLAVLPYAALAFAVGGMVLAWQRYQAEVDRVTQKVLDGSQAWKDGTKALDDYAAASPFVQQATSAQATGLAAMRTEQEAAVRALVEYVAKNGEGTEQEARMREAINARGQAITIATGQLRDHIVALDEGKLHGTDAIENLRSQRVAQDTVTEGIHLSDEELDKLAKKLDETYKAGALAVQDYVSQSTDFLQKSEQSHAEHQDRLTALYADKNSARTNDERTAVQARIDAENVGYAQQETNAALAYARQAGAQRAHLGDMLSDYTITQVQLGRISVEQGDAILGQIEHQFGTTQAISARTFGQMEQIIDHAAKSGGQSLNNLGGDLGHVADRAITTKEKMDALEKKYTMELVENTPEALRHTQAYLDKLAQIPAYVRTVVELEEHRMSEHEGRAVGGPISAGQTYLVGEKGPELVTFSASGSVVPADLTEQLLRGTGGGAEAGAVSTLANSMIGALTSNLSAGASVVTSTVRAVASSALGGAVATLTEGINGSGVVLTGAFRGAMAGLPVAAQDSLIDGLHQVLIRAERAATEGGQQTGDGAVEALRASFERIEPVTRAGVVDQLSAAFQDANDQSAAQASAIGQTAVGNIAGAISSGTGAITGAATSAAQSAFAAAMAAIGGSVGSAGGGGSSAGGGGQWDIAHLFGVRAMGGPVDAGQPYLVGERGPEAFVPQQSGYVLPNARMSPPASPAQIMNRTSTTTYNQQRVNNYQYAPTYAQAPRAPSVDFATMAAFGS
jgi:TP901 family phage tail tape measure protein